MKDRCYLLNYNVDERQMLLTELQCWWKTDVTYWTSACCASSGWGSSGSSGMGSGVGKGMNVLGTEPWAQQSVSAGSGSEGRRKDTTNRNYK